MFEGSNFRVNSRNIDISLFNGEWFAQSDGPHSRVGNAVIWSIFLPLSGRDKRYMQVYSTELSNGALKREMELIKFVTFLQKCQSRPDISSCSAEKSHSLKKKFFTWEPKKKFFLLDSLWETLSLILLCWCASGCIKHMTSVWFLLK